MASMYGHKWTGGYGDSDANNIWFATLRDLTPDQLKIGLVNCTNSDNAWPPSAPEFKSMCKPRAEDYGLPSKASAWVECCAHSHRIIKHTWSHPAVYQAGRKADWTQIRSMSNKPEVKKTFMEAYEELCKRVMAGESIDGPVVDENLLEHHSAAPKVMTEESKAAGRAALDKLKGIVK